MWKTGFPFARTGKKINMETAAQHSPATAEDLQRALGEKEKGRSMRDLLEAFTLAHQRPSILARSKESMEKQTQADKGRVKSSAPWLA